MLPVKHWGPSAWLGCGPCHAFKCTAQWPWCTPAPAICGAHPLQMRPTPNWNPFIRRSTGGSPSTRIFISFVRSVSNLTVVNTGSVSLSYDGDRRAAYLLLDDLTTSVRRVEYDVDRELKALATCGLPHADWTANMLETASPKML